MNVVVCVKQIPDPNAPGKLHPESKRLVREGVDLILDPGDEHAVEACLPAVVTVTGGINDARYPALRGIMQAKNKEVKQVGIAEIGLEGKAGKAALTQEVVEVVPAEARKAGEVVDDKGDGAKRIADFLQKLKVI